MALGTLWHGTRILENAHERAEKLSSLRSEVRQMRRDISMTGMRLDLLRGRIQSLGAPSETAGALACNQILQISPEFRPTVRENCARCQGKGGDCMVELLTRSSRRDS